jgi:hypothetical protein
MPDEPLVEDLNPGGRADPDNRHMATMTYAYSVGSRKLYVGYSGTPGGMSSRRGGILTHQMAARRIARISSELNEYEHSIDKPLKRSVYNCGEAAALSIAISHGEELAHLIFASFFKNDLVPPCHNCLTWINKAAGYYAP